jgi:hypothetical protein
MQDPDDVKNAIEEAAADPPEQKDQKVRKKPGRPRKNAINIPIEVRGNIDRAINEGDTMELIYNDPSLFHKMFNILKGYAISEVELNFDKNGLRIETMDRVKKVRIVENISGVCMNLYYCKEPIRIWVKRTDLDRVFGNLGKHHCKVTWILNEKSRHTLYIIIKGAEYNSDQIFEVDTFNKDAIDNQIKDDDTNYPIKFKISVKYLKKQITGVAKTSKMFTIQKPGDNPLQLTVSKAQTSNVTWTEVFNDAHKLELQSLITPDDVFNVSVEFLNILPFCKYAIGDDVYIAADKTQRISFQCFADRKELGWAASIKIYSEIVKTAQLGK